MNQSTKIAFKDSASRTYKVRPVEELELFRRIVEECDADALATYLDKNKANLVHFARRFCKSTEMAEDILMATVLGTLEKQAEKKAGEVSGFCDEARNFDTWFHTVLKNKSLNRINRTFHTRTQSGYNTASDHIIDGQYGQNYQPDFALSNALGDVSDGLEDPILYHLKHERQVAISETLKFIVECGQTSTDYKTALLYGQRKLAQLEDEELSGQPIGSEQKQHYQRIADETGVPIGTVRSRLHRARSHLQPYHSVLEPI